MTRIDQVKNRLWRLLRERPELAELDNQTEMLFAYWHEYHPAKMNLMGSPRVYFSEEFQLAFLTSFESISRARRLLIEQGKVKVSAESQASSDMFEEEYRVYILEEKGIK